MTKTEHFDVLMVGAGLSGIAAGYHLQKSLPNKSYAILESRDSLGGTWDLFKYPGIRSDSDMYTFAYSFRPWTNEKAIGDGADILQYMKDTAREFGIDKKIRFRHRVERASWSSKAARWTVDVRQGDSGKLVQFTCNFLFMCTGYYDYAEGYTPDFKGVDRFGKDRIIHPQKWDTALDYAGKRIVVIGSGATAMTLIPSLAKTAEKVTMLQRSPTYVVALPAIDPTANWLREKLPGSLAHRLTRLKNVSLTMAFFNYCRHFPEHATNLLLTAVERRIGKKVDVGTHFTPRYKPWDQRLCVVPNADLFKAIRAGKADVVTDQVDTFTENGILLKSGQELPADLIVTATGLQVQFVGGIKVFVDGALVEPHKELNYKGTLLTGVPNCGMAFGYTNASWMLKAELACQYMCLLLAHMDAKGYASVVPRAKERGVETPLVDLTSSYIQRAIELMPKQGAKTPWRLHQNYFLDLVDLRYRKIDDGFLHFERKNAVREAAPERSGTFVAPRSSRAQAPN
jgi:cation diffusion facilitator CzcD-associated flavoprotein CzcO